MSFENIDKQLRGFIYKIGPAERERSPKTSILKIIDKIPIPKLH